MTRAKRGRKNRNPGWFKKGKDARRSSYRPTREECPRGYRAALDACSSDVRKYAWLCYRIRGYYRAKRREHAEEKNGGGDGEPADAIPGDPAEPASDTNGIEAPAAPDNGNGQLPRKVVRSFTCLCGKDEHLVVEVVESQHQTKDGKIVILSAVCCRTYVKPDGEVGKSYSYRVQHIPLLTHLLGLAHAFIVSTRVVEDIPF